MGAHRSGASTDGCFVGKPQGDIVVVGGGFTGISAALHLAQGGAKVAVLEAVELGFGGAGRNVGLVNAGMWVMPNTLVDTLGTAYGERLLKFLGDAPSAVFDLIDKHGIDCEVKRSWHASLCRGRKGLARIGGTRSSMAKSRRSRPHIKCGRNSD